MLTLHGHKGPVMCLQFDSYKVVSGSYDKQLKIFDIRMQKCVHSLFGHSSAIFALQYDTNKIITGFFFVVIICVCVCCVLLLNKEKRILHPMLSPKKKARRPLPWKVAAPPGCTPPPPPPNICFCVGNITQKKLLSCENQSVSFMNC